jgi:hypothetical protein
MYQAAITIKFAGIIYEVGDPLPEELPENDILVREGFAVKIEEADEIAEDIVATPETTTEEQKEDDEDSLDNETKEFSDETEEKVVEKKVFRQKKTVKTKEGDSE